MSLPWVRLDSNIATHDKVLKLLAMRDGHRAFTLYVCSLGYAGGHATDGHVPHYALPHLHGTERTAEMLVRVGLWDVDTDGWLVHNWALRQELAVTTETKREAQRRAAMRTNCLRYHGPQCGCYQSERTVVPIERRRT